LTSRVLEVFNLVAQEFVDAGGRAGCLRFVGTTGFESRRGHDYLLYFVLLGRGLCDGPIPRPE